MRYSNTKLVHYVAYRIYSTTLMPDALLPSFSYTFFSFPLVFHSILHSTIYISSASSLFGSGTKHIQMNLFIYVLNYISQDFSWVLNKEAHTHTHTHSIPNTKYFYHFLWFCFSHSLGADDFCFFFFCSHTSHQSFVIIHSIRLEAVFSIVVVVVVVILLITNH